MEPEENKKDNVAAEPTATTEVVEAVETVAITEPEKESVEPEEPAKPAKKKHTGLIITLSILGAILVIGGVFATLVATGVISLGDLGLGLFGNPTVARAEETCAKYEGSFTDYDDSTIGDDLLAAYMCRATDNYVQFEFVELAKDFTAIEDFADIIEAATENDTEETGVVVLENSGDMLKAYSTRDYSDRTTYQYMVLYHDKAISLYTDSLEKAEDVLASVGFPRRNIADFTAETKRLEAVAEKKAEADDYNLAALAKLKTALLDYASNNRGSYPTPAYSYGEYYIDGEDNSEFDRFYNNYLPNDFVDQDGDAYILQAFHEPKEIFADDSELSIFFNATCNSNGELIESSNSRSFALTTEKSDGDGYLCLAY